MANMKIACVILAMCMIIAPMAEAAISCGAVSGALAPCLNYLRGFGRIPGRPCCGGVQRLNAAARTTLDRRTACNCLKNTARSIRGLNNNRAASLPRACGVNIPYKISASTNCNAIRA